MQDQARVWDKEYGKRGTRWSKRTLNLPEVFEGKTVLEMGVGNGKTLESIRIQNPRSIHACDFSNNALKVCKTADNVDLAQADARALPYRDGAFDIVVMYYILNNMSIADRETSSYEAQRVLKAGGLLLFEDFRVGDFRMNTAKTSGNPEPNTILKTKGLMCHYFSEDEMGLLFGNLKAVSVVAKEYSPFKNSKGLVRRTIAGVFQKADAALA